MCDFDMARVHPEMTKVGPVVVVSATGLNHRRAKAPGTCIVVPFSTVPPDSDGADDVFFTSGTYWSLPDDCWARCKMMTTVSHDRLDLVLRGGRRHPSEFLAIEDDERLAAAIRFAVSLT
jgi:uncharacterized protein YifN (PemK superfamily)